MGFGDFETICKKSALPLCSLIGSTSPISGKVGIEPNCYARSVEFANTIIFSAATDFMHILALGMTAVMILHVRSKFTAVGMSGPELLGEGGAPRMQKSTDVSKNRSQRDHHLLLSLHAPLSDLSCP